MRLWDRALTGTEAARTAILDASDPGLVADLRLLDGAGRTTADATGNHTAELVGSVAWIAYADVMKGGIGNETYVVDHVGDQALEEIGRAPGRERGCQNVEISVVAGTIKKKQT